MRRPDRSHRGDQNFAASRARVYVNISLITLISRYYTAKRRNVFSFRTYDETNFNFTDIEI